MHNSIMDYFPLKSGARPSQVKALDFIERMVTAGCTDIIVEAPTGIGKSAIGASCCYWAADWPVQVTEAGAIAKPGGYYLVTQKQLQDQIKKDGPMCHDFSSLWSSSGYKCDNKNLKVCQLGLRSKVPMCQGRKLKTCPYMVERAKFSAAIFSLTNYPFFMTERVFVGSLPKRNILVLDEAHTIEKQLLKFGEVEITDKLLREWDIRGVQVPEIDDKHAFAEWLSEKYLPRIESQLQTYTDQVKASGEEPDDELVQHITTLENQVHKIKSCVGGVQSSPENWVYWFDQTEREGNAAYCKPLDASPYMEILKSGGVVRIYMSAFFGDTGVFCKSLGLDEQEVACRTLNSGFKKENRPIVMGLVGSMSRKNQQNTLPSLLRVVDKILTRHHDEKGIIHCNSYELGDKIADHLKTSHPTRTILFPKKADERTSQYNIHLSTQSGPTVLLSPSMTEGFDFKDDFARWQIITKMPYPYLGDRQVAAKKDRSPDWYDTQTIQTVIQATGRICRSEEDWGVTYMLDEDFKILWDRRRSMFPAWFKEAIVWG